MRKSLMRKSIFMALVMVCTGFAYAQDRVLSGTVLDSATRAPIAFANIGIAGENTGTISAENGSFRLVVPERLLSHGLTVSAITHHLKVLDIGALQPDEAFKVTLKERVSDLGQVVVRSTEKLSSELFGIKEVIDFSCFTKKFNRGAQIAQLIQTENYPAKLNKIRFNIMMKYAPLVVRVRVFDRDDKTGLPGEELLHRSIIKPVRKRKPGWVELDVSKLDVWLENDFFVSVEFVRNGNFLFSCLNAEEYKDQQYVRVTSFGDWQKAESFFTFKNPTVMVIGAEVSVFKEPDNQ